MKLADYSVTVPEGDERQSGTIVLEHEQIYTLRIGNEGDRDSDAFVQIDGKKVGTWRVPKRKTITLEHPANDQGRFTFYRLGTPEARAAELAEGPDLGLIEVRFLPGKPKPPLQEAGYRGELIGICLFKDFYRRIGPAGIEGVQVYGDCTPSIPLGPTHR